MTDAAHRLLADRLLAGAAGAPRSGRTGPLGQGAPATPDADDARSAAAEELSRPAYRNDPSLLGQLWEWVKEHLDPARLIPGVPAWLSWLLVGIVLVALVSAIAFLARRVTRVGRRRRGSLFDDVRDAASLTLAANDAAGRGDWTTAIIERFRAIIRSLDERGLIEDYPGMTAHEASALASQALASDGAPASRRAAAPTGGSATARALTQDLAQAAELFDAVRYGRVVSSPAQDEWMRALAERVTQVRTAPQPAGRPQ